MLEIDGSVGEGGGQMLRTSLALSLVTRIPFRMANIRARRARPGLMKQHLTAVKAATEVSRADVHGDDVGSKWLEFRPDETIGGDYRFAVGTAGSATLVFQTILPALLGADRASRIEFEGGTHNPMAPPYEFLSRVFAPVVAKMGCGLGLELERAGFYPAGGGRFRAVIQPGQLQPVDLVERGPIRKRHATAAVASLAEHIARRELDAVKRRLRWSENECRLVELDSAGPGNVLLLEVESENVTEIVTGFGERGVRAEDVAEGACAELENYLDADVPVGPHLADQLLLLLALAGSGSFRTTEPTLHTTTQADLIKQFLPCDITIDRDSGNAWRVEVA